MNLAIKNSISNLWSHGIDKLVADQYESDETFERKGPLTRERALERFKLIFLLLYVLKIKS